MPTPALSEQSCQPYAAEDALAASAKAQSFLAEIPAWSLSETRTAIHRSFKFKDFSTAIQFVNVIADIAAKQDHHPDLHIFYNEVKVVYSTHSTGGLTMNDIVCAARVDHMFRTVFSA